MFSNMEGGAPRRLQLMEGTRKGSRSSPLQFFASLPTKNQEPRTRNAFTIIELVSVLAIIVVMLSIALGSYSGWTRASGIDAAANQTASILGHARELAITQRVSSEVVCENITPPGRSPCGIVSVYALDAAASFATNANFVLAMPTNALPAGVCFRSPTAQVIEFQPDGTCSPDPIFGSDGCALFFLDSTAGDAGRRLTRVVEVNQLSGRIRVRREDAP